MNMSSTPTPDVIRPPDVSGVTWGLYAASYACVSGGSIVIVFPLMDCTSVSCVIALVPPHMPQYVHPVGTIDVPLSNAPVPPFNREMTTTLPAVSPEVPDSVIV